LSITATLTVGSAETYTVSPQTLTFSYQIGGSTPATQQISVSATPNPVNFTVGTTSTGGWLSTDAGSGTDSTPRTINVSVNPANIPAASLVGGKSVSGTITISAPSVSASPTVVTVTVNIVAAPAPSPNTIFNSANINGFGPIAPGELITIKGSNLGPATPASYTVVNNTLSSTLGGVQVFFDATPGTPTYVSATQINVIVPWEVAGRAQTNITVSYEGGTSAPFTYNVVSATPAFYTLNATGAGQAAALNQDYSINGPAAGVIVGGTTIATKPASPGSEIAIYGTGGGVTNPGGSDGTVTPTTQLYPLMNASSVTATIGGQPATVYFAGAAPSLVTGVFQVNLKVPAGVTGDTLAVALTVNGVTTITGPTLSVH
ncbi:MAG TPA: IPT/TIG domain-containing protein, partial [Bryobacteraceae bacterium]|nr:IPT/TIG domain-containing protein [Bryobacteraceae bacterium]